jgi:Lysylphosphatidylglycerol synthase TM region
MRRPGWRAALFNEGELRQNQALNAGRGACGRFRMRRNLLHTLGAYGVAFGIIWYLARGIDPGQLARNLTMANLWVFLPACLGSFCVWFIGETLLFSSLFSYFHRRTSFREMLPANAAQYFLQLVNLAVAGSALVLFMNRRKQVPWLAGGCTLIFQALLDFQIMAAMALVAAALDPQSLIRAYWYFPAIVLAPLILNSWFWMRGRPRSRIGQWVYDRPSMQSFRVARPIHYAKLAAIRTAIFVGYGFMLYFQIRGFRVRVNLSEVLAFLPAVLLFDGLPFTPVGLGPVQVVLVTGFQAYASRARLLAMALSISFMNIVLQAPLGLGSAGAFAREVTDAARLGLLRDRAAEVTEPASRAL